MKSLLRFAKLGLGWLLLAVGLVFLPLPPPFAFGGVMALAGVVLLVSGSRRCRGWVQRLRGHWPGLSQRLERAGRWLPAPLGWAIRATRPRQGRAHRSTVD